MTRSGRRRRQFGSVERLASGRWRARFVGADGRQRAAPTTFATRTEADQWLATVRADLLRGHWAAPDRASITFGQYLADWQRQRAPQLRPRTRDLYARLAERWLTPVVGTGRHAVHLAPLRLDAIEPHLVREWVAAVRGAAYDSAAARLRGPTARGRTSPARAWARSVGLDVASTGRLPRAVSDAWRAAGSPDIRPARQVPPEAGATVAAQAYRLLHAVLAQAVTDGLLPANPAHVPGGGHVEHPERHPLTPAEVAALATAVPARYRAAVLVAAWSGLRPGEVFSLRRRDLDLDTATITVRRTMVEVSGQPVRYGLPKTRAGRRTVALPPTVAGALAEHLSSFTSPGLDSLVFTTRNGLPVGTAARWHVMRTARLKIDRADVTWHHLRHTGATLAATAGATQAELMHRIGHSSTRAAALYQHASAQRDQTIAAALDALVAHSGQSADEASRVPRPQGSAPGDSH